MRRGEAAAWQALDAALLDADERGQVIPCAGRWSEFTADDPEVLGRAAESCAACPVLDSCAAIVPFAWHGAWAGRVVIGGKVQEVSS